MCGGSLKPDPSYSPISSTPSASRGSDRVAAASRAGAAAIGSGLVRVVVDVAVQPVQAALAGRHELLPQHRDHTALLLVERRRELVRGQLLVLERADVPAHV